MVKVCPKCCSNRITFMDTGESSGDYFCEDCGFTGQVIFGKDEFEE